MRRRRYASKRTYRRRRYRRRTGKRRAAAQQRQRGRFVIKSSTTGSLVISPFGVVKGNTTAPNYAGTMAIGAYQNLLASNYMSQLMRMYDQFRLDSFRVKIVPTQSVLLNQQKQAVFVSAWDRNGIENLKNVPSFSEIASYSSAFQKAINLDATTWSATRKIYAASVMEKGAFLPTTTTTFGSNTNSTGAFLPPQQYAALPWNPVLLIGLLCSSATFNANTATVDPVGNQFTGTQTWNFVAQFEWTLTFRGLRYDVGTSAPMTNVIANTNMTAATNLGAYQHQPMNPDDVPTVNTTAERPAALDNAQIDRNDIRLRDVRVANVVGANVFNFQPYLGTGPGGLQAVATHPTTTLFKPVDFETYNNWFYLYSLVGNYSYTGETHVGAWFIWFKGTEIEETPVLNVSTLLNHNGITMINYSVNYMGRFSKYGVQHTYLSWNLYESYRITPANLDVTDPLIHYHMFFSWKTTQAYDELFWDVEYNSQSKSYKLWPRN